jgi:hypothetical protein
MASFQKYKKRNGSIVWRAQIFVKGGRYSKSFDTKSEAKLWAASVEADILSNPNRNPSSISQASSRTVEDIFDRYSKEVSVHKIGCRWEQILLKTKRSHGPFCINLNFSLSRGLRLIHMHIEMKVAATVPGIG